MVRPCFKPLAVISHVRLTDVVFVPQFPCGWRVFLLLSYCIYRSSYSFSIFFLFSISLTLRSKRFIRRHDQGLTSFQVSPFFTFILYFFSLSNFIFHFLFSPFILIAFFLFLVLYYMLRNMIETNYMKRLYWISCMYIFQKTLPNNNVRVKYVICIIYYVKSCL